MELTNCIEFKEKKKENKGKRLLEEQIPFKRTHYTRNERIIFFFIETHLKEHI